MNELIDELMIQAGARFEFLHGVHYDDFQYRKFAELIVRNCIEQAHSVGDLRGVNDDMIYGADYAAVQITKYFGVE